MIRKPFKPPGSKDGAAVASSTLVKPYVKPAPSFVLQPKPAATQPVGPAVSEPSEEKEPAKSTEVGVTTSPSPIIPKQPSSLLLNKGTAKPFKPQVSTKPSTAVSTTATANKPTSTTTTATTSSTPAAAPAPAEVEEFYKCFWSKDVKKKHKVLDDGIIVFTGNKVQLYNSDGGKIYDSYKSKLYCPNPDNMDQFIVGSYFVEQEAAIKKEDFMSGRCFVKAKLAFEKETLINKKKALAPAKINKSAVTTKPSDIEVPAKSYLMTDPTNPDLYPVFVDPYLNDHMRIHQKLGVKFMFECVSGLRGPDISGCILADSMGLGKTLQTIALIWVLLRRNPYSSTIPLIKKVVVVAPVSLLGTWRKEVKKWLGDARLIPKIAIGKREDVVNACSDFATCAQKMLLISYESFRIHIDLLQNCCDLLIFDEGHRLKNMNIKTFRSFNSIKCCRRIILTGTPLQNSLDEFYSCVKFVNPNIFENEKQFKFVFSEPILAAMKTDATPSAIEKASVRSKELTHIISRFVLRRKADILEKLLPPRSEYFIFVKMTPFQIMVYKKMILARHSKNEFDSDAGVFSLLTVMRKLLNHPQLIYTDQTNTASLEFKQYFPTDFALDDWSASYKFKFVWDVMTSMQRIENESKSIERIIIVSYWTQTLDVLEIMVKQMGLKFVRLDGSVNAQKRQELIDRFQDPTTDLRVFLLCGKAGGTGLNLSAANRMVLMEADWNPSNDLQVMGRIWRDGQKKPVHIYRLVSCGTMEEKVLQRQFLKEDLSGNVVDEKMVMKQYNNDTMKQLFEFKGDENCLTFKEDENQVRDLSSFTPDYVPSMMDYIPFLKRTIKGEMKKDDPIPEEDTTEVVNEFDEGNIFLKPEAVEEEEIKEIEENEEAIAQILLDDTDEKPQSSIKSNTIVDESKETETVKETGDEGKAMIIEEPQPAATKPKRGRKSTKNEPVAVQEQEKEEKQDTLIESINTTEKPEEPAVTAVEEEEIAATGAAEETENVADENEDTPKPRRGRKKAMPDQKKNNPAANILNKLKK